MKTIKATTSSCLLVLFWLLISSFQIQAQTEKQTQKEGPKAISETPQKNAGSSAIQELERFRPDPNDREMNELKYELLKFNATLEEGLKHRSLSQQEEAELTANISKVRKAIHELNASRSPKANSGNLPVTKNSKGQVEVSRSQYLKLSEVEKKEVAGSDSYTINNLVNAKPIHKSSRIDGLFYLTADQFYHTPVDKRMHILQNPELYIVFENANEIPKAKMSRAEFQSLPSSKQQYILQSGDFTIID
jgi:hypothetical protein